MVVGISVLSNELYFMLFEQSEMGSTILGNYAPVAILFGMFTVTAAILQGIDRQKWIVFTSLFGLFIKLSINIPLIKLFETNGAILATAIGYSVAIGINIYVITKTLQYRSTLVVRRIILIICLNIGMFVAVFATLKGLTLFSPPETRLHATLYVLICAIVGVVVYGYLSLKTGLAQKLLGGKVKTIATKLGF